jgi:hypothetical protein
LTLARSSGAERAAICSGEKTVVVMAMKWRKELLLK